MSAFLSAFCLDLSNYTQADFLGQGAFGSVYSAIEKKTGEKVAVKYIREPLHPDVREQRAFIRELEILAGNRHPCALGLRGFKFSSDPTKGPILVTDIMTKGTLDKIFEKERKKEAIPGWNATTKSKCVFGIVVGMAYCHSHGIIHCDLKPENVFLNDAFEPVIADFGISRHCSGGLTKSQVLGSPMFMAPELFDDDHDEYGYEVDVYAFAVTLFYFFAVPHHLEGVNPPKPPRSKEALMLKIMKGFRFAKEPGIPDWYWALIQQCWVQSPSDRPTFQQLLDRFHEKHEYALPGADMAELLAYEKKLYQKFPNPPKADQLVQTSQFTPAEEQSIIQRIENILAKPPPNARLMMSSRSLGMLIQSQRS